MIESPDGGVTPIMTMDVSKSETNKNGSAQQEICAGCRKTITERFLLKALDLLWHEDCLKCSCCDCRLGEVGSTLYTRANLLLCKRDYLRIFGHEGHCSACSKSIPPFEMVMRARTNVYHLECFACQQCNHRFCVGDRFYLCDNKILCEYDYEERLVFANMALHPPVSLTHLKRQLPPTPTPTPPGATQNLHPGHNQIHQGHPPQTLGQSVPHNHVNGQISSTPINGMSGARGPGDMNNNGLSGPGLGAVKPPPMSMPAPTS